MKQVIHSDHFVDTHGNPACGIAQGKGIAIVWQNGPLGRGPERQEPNGAFVEGVIQAAIDRLEFFQHRKFACASNARALADLRSAIAHLESRTVEREERGVEGTHAQ